MPNLEKLQSEIDELQKEVSRIQFHTSFDQKTKNQMMSTIEAKIEKIMEALN
mgnify:CR=1 FL=1